jgi:hypothetical protein
MTVAPVGVEKSPVIFPLPVVEFLGSEMVSCAVLAPLAPL